MSRQRALRRSRRRSQVDRYSSLRDMPLWQIYRMLSDLGSVERQSRVRLLIDVGHPDAEILRREYNVKI